MNSFLLSRIEPSFYASIADYKKAMKDNHDGFDGCSSLEKYDDIEKWHLNVMLFEREETLPPGYSIAFEYVYVHEDEVVGMINVRPLALTHPYLKRFGGHIGYSIKPSWRRHGVGTGMLHDMLGICRNDYGLNRILITCAEDNEGSRRVIMNNGGVLEGKILYPPEDKMIERYWISL
ncbi:MAG: GNAT family N-acetyltransferase [Erysipelotrichaceae bacterium]|nr:GNAT family N-acetyltransferase [Erysipelotrichaceae bacterium]MBQ6217907.1 GNAT family N-acetyltransferase [Erysipelotrichaceae bacterium]